MQHLSLVNTSAGTLNHSQHSCRHSSQTTTSCNISCSSTQAPPLLTTFNTTAASLNEIHQYFMEPKKNHLDTFTDEEIVKCSLCKDLFLESDCYNCDICQIFMCHSCVEKSGKWCIIPNIRRPHKSRPIETRAQIVCSQDCYEVFIS